MEDTLQNQDKTNEANAGNSAAALTGTPTSADVAKNSEAIRDHIDDAKDDLEDVEKEVKASPAADHEGLRGALDKLRNTFAHLVRHADHNVAVAQKLEAAPAATETAAAPAKPVSRATSDAHLNVGNGGAVTGNPGASFTQASAAQVAVDQGAKIPGVATIPQPDVAVR